MWWDLHDILTHNCLYNFAIGPRGAGKTYGCKKWAIKDFLKTGKQFIYLRRYKSEIGKKQMEKFFSAVKHEFPDTEFEVKGRVLYIDKKIAGYAVPLSTALTEKSTEYPDVNKIIYDEFVIDSKSSHLKYLSEEVEAFLEFYETVARLRDVRVMFLSNNVSVVNPYFLFWNLRPNQKKRFNKYGHMIIEFVQNEEFKEAKYKTKFGQIIQGTKYGNYAIENESLTDNMNFIEKKTGAAKFDFSIYYHGHTYGFWSDYVAGFVYCSYDVDPFNKLQFVLSDKDHRPNMLLVKNANSSFCLKQFLKAYEMGYMRFENIQIKNQCLEIFRLLKGGR